MGNSNYPPGRIGPFTAVGFLGCSVVRYEGPASCPIAIETGLETKLSERDMIVVCLAVPYGGRQTHTPWGGGGGLIGSESERLWCCAESRKHRRELGTMLLQHNAPLTWIGDMKYEPAPAPLVISVFIELNPLQQPGVWSGKHTPWVSGTFLKSPFHFRSMGSRAYSNGQWACRRSQLLMVSLLQFGAGNQ